MAMSVPSWRRPGRLSSARWREKPSIMLLGRAAPSWASHSPARVKRPLLRRNCSRPSVYGRAGKSCGLAFSRLLLMVARGTHSPCLPLTFAFHRSSRGRDLGIRWSTSPLTGTATIAQNTAATTSEPQPDVTLPMDITVRVEVQYHAPAGAVTRDVLEMFRSTTWVRFMMRYVSPRLKSSSPADQAILDELESQEAAEVHEGEECVICMSENPCDGHVALPCGHSFHYPCISSWLQNQSTCPVCRFQFPKAFTGKYAVQKLKSSMVLSEEQGKLPRTDLLALDIGKQVVRAVVSVTLVKVASEGDDEEFPCELSAWMLDPSTGETFSELDCI